MNKIDLPSSRLEMRAATLHRLARNYREANDFVKGHPGRLDKILCPKAL